MGGEGCEGKEDAGGGWSEGERGEEEARAPRSQATKTQPSLPRLKQRHMRPDMHADQRACKQTRKRAPHTSAQHARANTHTHTNKQTNRQTHKHTTTTTITTTITTTHLYPMHNPRVPSQPLPDTAHRHPRRRAAARARGRKVKVPQKNLPPEPGGGDSHSAADGGGWMHSKGVHNWPVAAACNLAE